MDNYYKILGVKNFASLEEIKIAYKKLAKKFHPDVNNGDKFFEEKFKELQTVYENLSDSHRRNIYDRNLIAFSNFLIQIQRLRLQSKQNTTSNQGMRRPSPYTRFRRRRPF